MRILPTMCGVLALSATGAGAQLPGRAAPVEYDVRFDNAVHHEAQVAVTYRNVGKAPLRLEMSRSSPGRYAIHEFAKNVYSVSARDGRGRQLPVGRTDPYGWTVAGHDGTVTVSYTLYADRGDGTYSQIDSTHAHLNMPATFLWARGFEDRPIRIRFRPYDRSWKIATQLPSESQSNSFWAPNLQYFMDSPTELSDHGVREWPVEDSGRRYTIRLAAHHEGTAADLDRLAEMTKKVVRQHIAVFGEAPRFDHGSYTFLADYLPHVTSDGMEHRNSTVVTGPRSLAEADFSQIQTISHEFFHAWNVERLRPAELEPFDFTRANPTPSLWLAEGFTNYYGPLAIRRAGLSSIDSYLQGLSGALNAVVNGSGRRYGSPQEMSLRAPFVDAATAIDPVNRNIFISYYTYGSILALALDLQLRQRARPVALDDYMRRLWKIHGVPERSYRPADLQARLAEVTGDAAFAEAFFAASIRGSELPDFGPLLAQAGLKLRRPNEGRAYAGPAMLSVEGGAATLTADTVPDTPLYRAGIDRGDRIVSLDGTPIANQADWDAAVGRHKPGDRAELRFVQRGRERRVQILFEADPTLDIVRYETVGLPLTPAQKAFRDAWIGPAGKAN